jgi:hypothetical protein
MNWPKQFSFAALILIGASGAIHAGPISTTIVMDLSCSSGCNGTATATWEILGSSFSSLPIDLDNINPGDLVFSYTSSDASFSAATLGAGDIFGGTLATTASFENFGGNNDEFAIEDGGSNFALSHIGGSGIDSGTVTSAQIESPVPEPGTLGCAAGALLAAGLVLRRPSVR